MTNQMECERLECDVCGDAASELRWTGYDTRLNDANPMCEDCYLPPQTGGCGDPVMDGPCFDDLPIAQKGA